MKSKLIVVGSGIKSVAHISEETKKVIRKAEKVLYLVNEDVLKQWIARENPQSESLEALYFSSDKRVDVYDHITEAIISSCQTHACVCVIFYGHATLFARSALRAVKQVRARGGIAHVLPAISSIDCLFSDLTIDPGAQGYFSIDATELVLYERHIDVKSHLILWQVGNFGQFDTSVTTKLSVLKDYLRQFYASDHTVCLYEASQYPGVSPKINHMPLNELDSAEISLLSMLYVPPINRDHYSKKYAALLGMQIENFSLSRDINTVSD